MKKVTNEMVDNAALYNSETNDPVSADELGITYEEYYRAVRESLECDQPEGHIEVSGRRVYAIED